MKNLMSKSITRMMTRMIRDFLSFLSTSYTMRKLFKLFSLPKTEFVSKKSTKYIRHVFIVAIFLFFATPGGVFAAISFVSNQIDLPGPGTVTAARDVGSGTNRLLAVFFSVNSGTFSAVTYGGVAMTHQFTVNDDSRTLYGYTLLNPTSGSNNIVITELSALSVSSVRSTVYNGALNVTSPNTNSGSGTSGSVSITAGASDSWLVGWAGNNADVLTAGANTTIRSGASASGTIDSNGTVSPTALNFAFNGSSAAWDAGGFSVDTSAPASPVTPNNDYEWFWSLFI